MAFRECDKSILRCSSRRDRCPYIGFCCLSGVGVSGHAVFLSLTVSLGCSMVVVAFALVGI